MCPGLYRPCLGVKVPLPGDVMLSFLCMWLPAAWATGGLTDVGQLVPIPKGRFE